jgi:hypothetical protein
MNSLLYTGTVNLCAFSYTVNMFTFTFYRLIGKLTAFLQLQEFSFLNQTVDSSTSAERRSPHTSILRSTTFSPKLKHYGVSWISTENLWEWKMFQPSTICKGESGTKINPFTYGFTTFVGKKFIDSCSLGLSQMASKTYHSVARNKDYKVIPSLLLPRPTRRYSTPRRSPLPPAPSFGETAKKNTTFRKVHSSNCSRNLQICPKVVCPLVQKLGNKGPKLGAKKQKNHQFCSLFERLWRTFRNRRVFHICHHEPHFWNLRVLMRSMCRRKSARVVAKGAGQSGVQSQWVGTTWFRRLVQKDSCFEHEQVRHVLKSFV